MRILSETMRILSETMRILSGVEGSFGSAQDPVIILQGHFF
jgi:hypothetical protein